jgi:hypothetical protein
MWTDGSVDEDQYGVGAFLLYKKNDIYVHHGCLPSGGLSSSYRAEGVAIYGGFERLLNLQHKLQVGRLQLKAGHSLLICTDSQ